jgi:hypothetical protein
MRKIISLVFTVFLAVYVKYQLDQLYLPDGYESPNLCKIHIFYCAKTVQLLFKSCKILF